MITRRRVQELFNLEVALVFGNVNFFPLQIGFKRIFDILRLPIPTVFVYLCM